MYYNNSKSCRKDSGDFDPQVRGGPTYPTTESLSCKWYPDDDDQLSESVFFYGRLHLVRVEPDNDDPPSDVVP
jgi:hypothetical protein